MSRLTLDACVLTSAVSWVCPHQGDQAVFCHPCRWQSARTPNTRGQADREDGSVRAEGAGAHLWDHHDHLQRPRRPPSGHSQKVLAAVPKYRQSTGKRPQLHWKQLWQWSQARVGGMETVVGHAADAAEPCSAAHELRPGLCALLNTAPPKSHEVGAALDSGTLWTAYRSLPAAARRGSWSLREEETAPSVAVARRESLSAASRDADRVALL